MSSLSGNMSEFSMLQLSYHKNVCYHGRLLGYAVSCEPKMCQILLAVFSNIHTMVVNSSVGVGVSGVGVSGVGREVTSGGGGGGGERDRRNSSRHLLLLLLIIIRALPTGAGVMPCHSCQRERGRERRC